MACSKIMIANLRGRYGVNECGICTEVRDLNVTSSAVSSIEYLYLNHLISCGLMTEIARAVVMVRTPDNHTLELMRLGRASTGEVCFAEMALSAEDKTRKDTYIQAVAEKRVLGRRRRRKRKEKGII